MPTNEQNSSTSQMFYRKILECTVRPVALLAAGGKLRVLFLIP